ncbi:adenylosuccinate lyase, partial [Clostridioides difficile]
SFLSLFEGDHEKVKELDKKICKKMGYHSSYAVSGQTYTRKLDWITMIKVENLHKSFKGTEVLKGINLEISQSEVVAILGSSGTG